MAFGMEGTDIERDEALGALTLSFKDRGRTDTSCPVARGERGERCVSGTRDRVVIETEGRTGDGTGVLRSSLTGNSACGIMWSCGGMENDGRGVPDSWAEEGTKVGSLLAIGMRPL